METRAKVYICLLILLPAIFYYLYVVNTAPPFGKKTHYLPERQLVFHDTAFVNSDAYEMAVELNQNVLEAESAGYQLIRNPQPIKGYEE